MVFLKQQMALNILMKKGEAEGRVIVGMVR